MFRIWLLKYQVHGLPVVVCLSVILNCLLNGSFKTTKVYPKLCKNVDNILI